jgi:hypothetical protein
MDDTGEPGNLGGGHYAFVSIQPRTMFVVDVATGKQIAMYPLGDVPLSYAFLGRTRSGHIAGVIGSTGIVVIDGKLVTVEAPTCKE